MAAEKKKKGTSASGPRVTMGVGLMRCNTQMGVAPPRSAPPSISDAPPSEPTPVPPSAPPSSGRYSSLPEDLRVDDVGRTTIVAKKDALDTMRPSIIAETMRRRAPLATRDALLVSLVDGTRNVSDLVDATGIPNAEVRKILDRLVQLGIVANWG